MDSIGLLWIVILATLDSWFAFPPKDDTVQSEECGGDGVGQRVFFVWMTYYSFIACNTQFHVM